ncbi:MAG: AMP-binding protein [Gammaproteobacteria bacterium]|nr:AMP-binding protein [Gammaproteobacteria bacterium]
MTVYRAFQSSVSRFSERPFLRAPASSTRDYAAAAIEFSYQAANASVSRLIAGYSRLGISFEDRVAVAFDSRLDVYLHLLSLNALGASIVPLNMAGSDDEVRYVIEHSDASLVTGTNEHFSRLQRIVESIDGGRAVSSDAIDAEPQDVSEKGEADTEAALLYTSGTTGKPKGCMLSNEYFLTMGREYNDLGDLCAIDENDRLATPLPPNHMNALATSFMAMLLCGGCVIQLDRFHPRSWWKTVSSEGATVIHYLGVMPAILLTQDPGDDVATHIRFGFGAGSDPRHQQVFEERFGFPLIEAWAMTETGGGGMIVANSEPRHLGKRCIGKPIESMEFRIAGNDDEAVATGEDGELLVRSMGTNPRAGFFSAYYKDAEAAEAGWRGGWWHTGDIIRQGADGSLYFVDRSKNVIRRSGENIAAIEVETVLLQFPLVKNCAVTAVPDEMRGDEVFALVVAGSDSVDHEQLARQVFDESMQLLTYFKTPGYIQFVNQLPLTGSQKVNRAAVKTQARDAVVAGSCIDLREFKRRRSTT